MTVTAPLKTTEEKIVVAPIKRKGGKLSAFLSIVCWQLIALMTVEGVLFWAGLGEEDIYQLDPEIGFKHFPNKRVTWRSEGYSQSWFNADGLRDPGVTIAKPAGVYRIALLGDSMVEGLQVPVEYTFGKLVQKELNAKGHPEVEVVNFANSGYSTAQEYLELKQKVLKYKPDLVLLGYMNRDMFENWSPPDQTITNVRPFALHLPGQSLVLDNAPVLKWMKTPRAKFLMQVQWLRQNSRIWGLISSTETQLSSTDPFYKGIVAFISSPSKATRQWWKSFRNFITHPQEIAKLAAPSFSIKFFENGNQNNANAVNSSINQAPGSIPRSRFVSPEERQRRRAIRAARLAAAQKARAAEGTSAAVAEKTESKVANNSGPATSASDAPKTTAPAGFSTLDAAGNANGAGSAVPQKTIDVSKAKNGNKEYVALMTNTMRSLITEMNAECRNNGSKFAVLILPSRAQLSPTAGMETNFFYLNYHDEIRILNDVCTTANIPMFNAEEKAENLLSPSERPGLFYLMHMNAKGHLFLANQLFPFLQKEVSK